MPQPTQDKRGIWTQQGGIWFYFIPMIAESYSAETEAAQYPGWVAGRALYDSTRSKFGTKSVKVSLSSSEAYPVCGGSHFYAGRKSLPTPVSQGHSVWFSQYFYFPSTMSWGYNYGAVFGESLSLNANADTGATVLSVVEVNAANQLRTDVGKAARVLLNNGSYHLSTVASFTETSITLNDALPSPANTGNNLSTGDHAEADVCNKEHDGGLWAKFMHFAPSSGTARVYFEIRQNRRNVASITGVRIKNEAGTSTENNSVSIPTDQWVALQIQVYVHSDNSLGFTRIWMGDQLLVEDVSRTITDSGFTINQYGVGDYWNGGHFTDGAAGRSDFWADNLIVATDVAGYGAPRTTDSSGNIFIGPEIRAQDV